MRLRGGPIEHVVELVSVDEVGGDILEVSSENLDYAWSS